MGYGDNMLEIAMFIILFCVALTVGVILVYFYIRLLVKLFDWLESLF